MEDQPTAESPQLLTELFDKMMDRLHCQAGTSDATCRGYVDDRWYPRYHTRANDVQITGSSTANRPTADDGEWSDSTVEVEVKVVRVRNDPMTSLPRRNSDDSSEESSDATEGEDEQEIFSMCYECNEKVPIQMKENGTCHGRYFHCQRRQ